MLPSIRVFLVRHGQTAWNVDKRAQGHTDIPLYKVGIAQADGVGRFFANASVGLVLASDLKRAHQTALAIGGSVKTDPLLREQGFGEWEGDDYLEVRRRFIAAGDHPDVTPPRGESKRDVWNRLESIHQRLSETLFDTAVVSHGGTSSLLCARLLGGTVEMAASFKFSNGGVTEFERMADGRFRLIRYDDVSHLSQIGEKSAHGVLG
ncbi:MAG: histidine phosphatase family protein [Armatimonadota bacterium]